MKTLSAIAVVFGLVSASSQADPALNGIWILTGEAQQRFIAPCRDMKLEFTEDSRLVRTTGTLIYTTVVQFKPDGEGWLLEEKLESKNDGAACSGKSSEEFTALLKQRRVYVELRGSMLRYQRAKGQTLVLEFERADTQQALARDVRNART